MSEQHRLALLSKHPQFHDWFYTNRKCSCGAEKAWFDYVPDKILFVVCVKLACCIHDHRYEVGGDELNKLIADRELMNNILVLVDFYGATHKLFPTSLARYRAMTYYNGVILGGKKSFNFKGIVNA